MQALVGRLGPGQTGCLLGGVYLEDVSIGRGGAAGRPVTLRAAPGDTATIRGRFWIADSADWVTVSYLRLDGRNATHLPSPTVNGDHATFTYDDVTNDRAGGVSDSDGVCFLVGDAYFSFGVAWYTTISHSRIHDCGTSNNNNRGIYLAASYYARVLDNRIYDNADRGVQLYPDAQHTLIRNNLIAGNGEGVIFSGDSKHASSNNVLIHNVIVDSRIRWNVEYSWMGPVGSNNVVTDNCIRGGHEGNILMPEVGYHASGNLFLAPQFLDDSWLSRVTRPAACAAFVPPAAG